MASFTIPSNIVTSLIVLFMFQVIVNTSIANAQLLPPTGLNLPGIPVRVQGKLCCPGFGATCPGSGISNTNVSLVCTNSLNVSIVVGQATTNANGSFSITINNLLGLLGLGNPSTGSLLTLPCQINTVLPVNTTLCPVLVSTGGLLISVLGFAGTLVDSVLGVVLNFIVTGSFFIAVPVPL